MSTSENKIHDEKLKYSLALFKEFENKYKKEIDSESETMKKEDFRIKIKCRKCGNNEFVIRRIPTPCHEGLLAEYRCICCSSIFCLPLPY